MLEFDKGAAGRTIRSLRRERGLSQEVLSGFAGIARTHLTMIENGTKQANFETIWRIALALDLRPSQLVEQIERECLAPGSTEADAKKQTAPHPPPPHRACGGGFLRICVGFYHEADRRSGRRGRRPLQGFCVTHRVRSRGRIL